MKRVVFDIILFVSVFIFPWWVSGLLLLIGIFIFNHFYEFIFTSVIIYSLFAIPNGRLISSPAFFSLFIIFLFIFIQIIKDNIIVYKK